MVAIGNGSRVGGGAEITPEADPGDGKMDVMVSFSTIAVGQARVRRPLPPRHPPRARRRALPARHDGHVSGQDFYCSADGELYGPERNRTWHLEPAAFSMPLPEPPSVS